MKILAMSDIHGSLQVYRMIPRWVEEHKPEAVVLAGDLLGVSDDAHTVEENQRASRASVQEILRQVTVPVLYIMGNDDLIELEPEGGRIQSLHGTRIELGRYNFVGYQYSLPFMGGIHEKPEEEIERDLDRLQAHLDEHTVLVTHSPAKGILDDTFLGSAGSASLLALVERKTFRVHIHGHIHSCFGREGRHFNVASGLRVRGMLIDLSTLRHEVLGSPALPGC